MGKDWKKSDYEKYLQIYHHYHHYLLCICVCVYLCGGICMLVHVIRSPSIESPGIGGLGACENFSVGAGNPTLVFCNHWASLHLPRMHFDHQPLAMLVGYTTPKLRVPRFLKSQCRFPWKPFTCESKVHSLWGDVVFSSVSVLALVMIHLASFSPGFLSCKTS